MRTHDSLLNLDYMKTAAKSLDDKKNCSTHRARDEVCHDEDDFSAPPSMRAKKRAAHFPYAEHWTNTNITRNGLVACGVDKDDRQHFAAANTLQENIFANENSLELQKVPYHHKKPQSDARYIISLSTTLVPDSFL